MFIYNYINFNILFLFIFAVFYLMIIFFLKKKNIIVTYVNTLRWHSYFFNFYSLIQIYKIKIQYFSKSSTVKFEFYYKIKLWWNMLISIFLKWQSFLFPGYFLKFLSWNDGWTRWAKFFGRFLLFFCLTSFTFYTFQEFYMDELLIIKLEFINNWSPFVARDEKLVEDNLSSFSWYASRYFLHSVDKTYWHWISYSPISFTVGYTCVLITVIFCCFICLSLFPSFFLLIRNYYLFSLGIFFYLLCSSFWPDWEFFREFERWEFLAYDFPVWFYSGKFYGYGDDMTVLEWFNIYLYSGVGVSSDYAIPDMEFFYLIIIWFVSNIAHMDGDDEEDYREFLLTDENINLISDESDQERQIFWYTKNISSYFNYMPRHSYDLFWDIRATRIYMKEYNLLEEELEIKWLPEYFFKHYIKPSFFVRIFNSFWKGRNYGKRVLIGLKGIYTIPFLYWVDYTKKMYYFENLSLLNSNLSLHKIDLYNQFETSYDFFFQTYINYWKYYSWKHRSWYTDWAALNLSKTLFIPPYSTGFFPHTVNSTVWYSKFHILYLKAIKLNKEQIFMININKISWLTNLFKSQIILDYFKFNISKNDQNKYKQFIKINLPKIHRFKYNILIKKHISLFHEMDFNFASKNQALWERLYWKKHLTNKTFLTTDWDGFSRIFTLGSELIRLQSFRLYYHESQYAKDGQNYINSNWKIPKNTSSQLYQYYDWIINGPIIKYINNNYDDRIYPRAFDPEEKGVHIVADWQSPKDLVPWDIYNSDICENWVTPEVKSKVLNSVNTKFYDFFIQKFFSYKHALIFTPLLYIFSNDVLSKCKEYNSFLLTNQWSKDIVIKYNLFSFRPWFIIKTDIVQYKESKLIKLKRRVSNSFFLSTNIFDSFSTQFNQYIKMFQSKVYLVNHDNLKIHGISILTSIRERSIYNYKLNQKNLKFKKEISFYNNQISVLFFKIEKTNFYNSYLRWSKYYYYKNKKYLFHSLFHEQLIKPFINTQFSPSYYEPIYSKNRINPLRRDFYLFSTVDNKSKIEKEIKQYFLPVKISNLTGQSGADKYLHRFERYWKTEYQHSKEFYAENKTREIKILDKIKQFEEISKYRRPSLDRWKHINNLLEPYDIYQSRKLKYIDSKNHKELKKKRFFTLPVSWWTNLFLTKSNDKITGVYPYNSQQNFYRRAITQNRQIRLTSKFDNMSNVKNFGLYGYNHTNEDKGYIIHSKFNNKHSQEWFQLSKEAPGFYHNVEYSPLDPVTETSVGGDKKELELTQWAQHPDMERDLFIQRHSFIQYYPNKFKDIKHTYKRKYHRLLNLHNFPDHLRKLTPIQKKRYYLKNYFLNSSYFNLNEQRDTIIDIWNFRSKINNITNFLQIFPFFTTWYFSNVKSRTYKILYLDQIQRYNFVWSKINTNKPACLYNSIIKFNQSIDPVKWVKTHCQKNYIYKLINVSNIAENLTLNSQIDKIQIDKHYYYGLDNKNLLKEHHRIVMSTTKFKNKDFKPTNPLLISSFVLNKLNYNVNISIDKFFWQRKIPCILNFSLPRFNYIYSLNNINCTIQNSWNLSKQVLNLKWQKRIDNWDWAFFNVYHQIIEFTGYNYSLGLKNNQNIKFPNLSNSNYSQLPQHNICDQSRNKIKEENPFFYMYQNYNNISKRIIKQNSLNFYNSYFLNFLPILVPQQSLSYRPTVISYFYFDLEIKSIKHHNWFSIFINYFDNPCMFSPVTQFFIPENFLINKRYINQNNISNNYSYNEKISPLDFKLGKRENLKNWTTRMYPTNWKYEINYSWSQLINFSNFNSLSLNKSSDIYNLNYNLFCFYKSNFIYKKTKHSIMQNNNITLLGKQLYFKLYSFIETSKFSEFSFYYLPRYRNYIESDEINRWSIVRKKILEKEKIKDDDETKTIEVWEEYAKHKRAKEVGERQKREEDYGKAESDRVQSEINKEGVYKEWNLWEKIALKNKSLLKFPQRFVKDRHKHIVLELDRRAALKEKEMKWVDNNFWFNVCTVHNKNELIVKNNPFIKITNKIKPNNKWITKIFFNHRAKRRLLRTRVRINLFKSVPNNDMEIAKNFNYLPFAEKINKLILLQDNYNLLFLLRSNRIKLSNYLNINKLQLKRKNNRSLFSFTTWNNNMSSVFSISPTNTVSKLKVELSSYWGEVKKYKSLKLESRSQYFFRSQGLYNILFYPIKIIKNLFYKKKKK